VKNASLLVAIGVGQSGYYLDILDWKPRYDLKQIMREQFDGKRISQSSCDSLLGREKSAASASMSGLEARCASAS
jgi:hypothetical protein